VPHATVSPTSTDPDVEFYSVREFAFKARRGLNQLYQAIHNGEIIASRIGGSWRIPSSELDRLRRGEARDPSSDPDDDTRFYILAGRLHGLGPRVVAEFLLELARERMLRVVVESKLRDWTERLDVEMIRIVGADQPPAALPLAMSATPPAPARKTGR
jgi:excisionase family DNA binding protein